MVEAGEPGFKCCQSDSMIQVSSVALPLSPQVSSCFSFLQSFKFSIKRRGSENPATQPEAQLATPGLEPVWSPESNLSPTCPQGSPAVHSGPGHPRKATAADPHRASAKPLTPTALSLDLDVVEKLTTGPARPPPPPLET